MLQIHLACFVPPGQTSGVTAVGMPVLLCGTAIAIPMVINNRWLATFAQGLLECPLPVDTVVVRVPSELGKVNNGNSCWYRAQQTMLLCLSRQEIEYLYAGVMFPRILHISIARGEDAPSKIAVDVSSSGKPSVDGRVRFTTSLIDAGSRTTLDLCH
jgi:hypothetical protein